MSPKIHCHLTRVLSFVALAASFTDPALAACPTNPLPEQMRAVRMHEYGGPEVLRIETIDRPSPGPGELLIAVKAASVNPIDWKLRQGMVKSWWPLTFPAIPGRDLSGVVVGIGSNVEGWKCGDAVAALVSDSTQSGAYAEFVDVDVRDVVRKHASMSFEQAAAFPLVAVTAWSHMVEIGRLKAGEHVLIQGGAGGVGSVAVQIAKALGAKVTATASARNHDFLTSLGADELVDYRSVRFEDVVSNVDLVFDAVGGETLARSPVVLRDGGRLVSIAGRLPKECAAGRIECPTEIENTQAGERALSRVSELIASGKLKMHVDQVFPLDQAAAAQESNREGHTRGKIVLRIAD